MLQQDFRPCCEQDDSSHHFEIEFEFISKTNAQQHSDKGDDKTNNTNYNDGFCDCSGIRGKDQPGGCSIDAGSKR